MAGSVRSALALARTRTPDVVFVRLARPGGLRALRGARGRVAALVGGKPGRGAWRGALRRARGNANLDVGLARGRGLNLYLRVLRRVTGRHDSRPPAAPRRLRRRAPGANRVRLAWSGRGARAFGLYRNGTLVRRVPKAVGALGGLKCGTEYVVEVDAVDRSGNRSAKRALRVRTADCGGLPRHPEAPLGPADYFVATNGSDANPCTRSAPCASFDRAYRVARPGQVVDVMPGVYGGGDIGVDATKTGATEDVFFRPHEGGAVSVQEMVDIRGSHVELRSMRFAGWYVKPGADDVTLRNIHAAGIIFISSASNVRVLGGEVETAGRHITSDSQIKSISEDAAPPTNILIDGVHFHDFQRPPGSGAHIECLQVGSFVNMTIRNSRFERCNTQGLFIRSWGEGYPVQGLLVEGNFFGELNEGYYPFKFKADLNPDQCSGIVRDNVAEQDMLVEGCGGPVYVANNRRPDGRNVLSCIEGSHCIASRGP
jgi:hypothetical protein